jgi:hypothetical protein
MESAAGNPVEAESFLAIGRHSQGTGWMMLCSDLVAGSTPFVKALPFYMSTDNQMTLSHSLEVVGLNGCSDRTMLNKADGHKRPVLRAL